jgi:hypothetical protein
VTGWEEGVITGVSSKEICRRHKAEVLHILNMDTERKERKKERKGEGGSG